MDWFLAVVEFWLLMRSTRDRLLLYTDAHALYHVVQGVVVVASRIVMESGALEDQRELLFDELLDIPGGGGFSWPARTPSGLRVEQAAELRANAVGCLPCAHIWSGIINGELVKIYQLDNPDCSE